MATAAAINSRGAVTVINDAEVSSTTDSRHSGGRARFRLLGRCYRSRLGWARSAMCLKADGGVGWLNPIFADAHECLHLRLVRLTGAGHYPLMHRTKPSMTNR